MIRLFRAFFARARFHSVCVRAHIRAGIIAAIAAAEINFNPTFAFIRAAPLCSCIGNQTNIDAFWMHLHARALAVIYNK